MISKDFDVAHIDLMDLKIKYPSINELKADVYPFETDEAKTYIDDGRIIFACGVKMIKSGVAHCWVIPSIYVYKYGKTFYKEIRFLLEDFCRRRNIHRMQTTVVEEFVIWIERLGFEREAILKQIGSDKSDEYLYRKLY